ncbi:hypothetical protein [Duganella radicis]|uniref:Haemophore haem-binding domain-containing protein n=1 Tax=Duganella radicis TaxID=551988 RepID=A0A6L6PBG2_9BURK|nr:hypothetical protein [Duganella radicis]MTV36304.1 hypothetical protein [Duganella radicis]
MKFRNISLAALLSVITAMAAAQAPAPAPVAAQSSASCVKQKLSSESLVSELLDEPAAREVLYKHIPELRGNDQFDMARSMPLRAIQPYSEETFTDKVLDAIDADLAKLPICK